MQALHISSLRTLGDIYSEGVHIPARSKLTTPGSQPSFRATTVPYLSVVIGLQG